MWHLVPHASHITDITWRHMAFNVCVFANVVVGYDFLWHLLSVRYELSEELREASCFLADFLVDSTTIQTKDLVSCLCN